jgi:fatty-acyl-CoA synthase
MLSNCQTDWLAKWAIYTPNRFFLREYETGREWTYSEFNKCVNHIVEKLISENNIKPGDRLAVYSTNNIEYVALFFVCVRTGAILVPLNFRLMPDELNFLIQDAEPKYLFYENIYKNNLNKIPSIKKIHHTIPIETISEYLNLDLTIETKDFTGNFDFKTPVMILYTSGTTGTPKGAIINHQMLYWNAINTGLRLDLNSADHTQGFAPFFHTGGWNVLFTPFLLHGASHTLLKKFDADLILHLMEKEKATILFGVPTMLQMMADSSEFQTVDLTSVRYAIVGGAPMPIPLIEKWHRKGVFIRQGYGLTEVGPNCFSLHHDDAIRKIGSIGFPNFYIEAKVMQNDNHECGIDEVGELWLRSPVVTPGYWKNEEATRSSITDGWFHTGDLVKRDSDGYFFVVDRKKNMFISGGENVYPAEIEKFLYTSPAVKEIAVIGIHDDKWGETGKAYIVLNEGYKISEKDIIEFCKGRIAKFKIPKHVAFIKELPRNEAGKIDRIKLKELHNKNT